MGYKEAIEDNIKIKRGKYDNFYFPKCHICGSEVVSLTYNRTQKYTCKACKTLGLLSDKNRQVIDNYDAKERKFDNAVNRIKKQYTRLPKSYQRAFGVIHSKLHRRGWFDSTEEIMVAIELVCKGIKARHQVKMGRYRVDFLLPELKVVLEVDGHLFHNGNTSEKEKVRDNLIIANLGSEWEVIRISDTLINKNIKMLVKSIKSVIDTRKKLRNQYGGLLPNWYNADVI